MQLVQAPADVWELGKEALGLGETTPEGEEGTGIANGVPFVVRYRDTVGSLEAGAPVLVHGMGLVRAAWLMYRHWLKFADAAGGLHQMLEEIAQTAGFATCAGGDAGATSRSGPARARAAELARSLARQIAPRHRPRG